MAFGFARQPDLTILSTQDSNSIELFEDAFGLGIQAPATLTSSAITVLVTVSTSAGATFSTLQSGGVDITLGQGKALIITPIPYKQLKLHASGVEAGDRTFGVSKVFHT